MMMMMMFLLLLLLLLLPLLSMYIDDDYGDVDEAFSKIFILLMMMTMMTMNPMTMIMVLLINKSFSIASLHCTVFIKHHAPPSHVTHPSSRSDPFPGPSMPIGRMRSDFRVSS